MWFGQWFDRLPSQMNQPNSELIQRGERACQLTLLIPPRWHFYVERISTFPLVNSFSAPMLPSHPFSVQRKHTQEWFSVGMNQHLEKSVLQSMMNKRLSISSIWYRGSITSVCTHQGCWFDGSRSRDCNGSWRGARPSSHHGFTYLEN